MRQNCNLELRLSSSSSSAESFSSGSSRHRTSQSQQQQQQLTIFYNGVLCVCDVTELQARAILCVANKEMEKLVVNTSARSRTLSAMSRSTSALLAPPRVQYSPQGSSTSSNAAVTGGLSMKKSLQKFLHKRKLRIQATHPY